MYRRAPSTAARRSAHLVLAALLPSLSSHAGDAAAKPDAAAAWRFSLELRGRFEAFTGLDFRPANNDAYYLNRFRLGLLWEPRTWLRLGAAFQDARAVAHRRPPPASAHNPADLFEAYVEAGGETRAWSVRAGRQRLSFGAERLVGLSDWANTSRVFDTIKLSHKRAKVRFDAFAAALVRPVPGHFDRFRDDAQLHGVYGSTELRSGATLEPYVLWKRTRGGGGQSAATTGLRWAGPLPQGFDYEAEVAFQAGREAGERLRAWAGSGTLGKRLGAGDRAPRLALELNRASGDRNPDDAVRGTFDQLFPTNHNRYGIADRIGWRNMQGARLGLTVHPAADWTAAIDYHSFWLASRGDFLYGADGSPVVRNPAATSSHTHQELDLQIQVRPAEPLTISLGYARVFPGRFLRESSPGCPLNFVFLMWRLRL